MNKVYILLSGIDIFLFFTSEKYKYSIPRETKKEKKMLVHC